jgi:hypothetical protein
MLWLLAVATVFAGIALGELPPAWEAGEAVALPSARERLGEAIDDGLRTTPNGEVEAVGPGVRSAGEAERTAGGARRKRKRRR